MPDIMRLIHGARTTRPRTGEAVRGAPLGTLRLLQQFSLLHMSLAKLYRFRPFGRSDRFNSLA